MMAREKVIEHRGLAYAVVRLSDTVAASMPVRFRWMIEREGRRVGMARTKALAISRIKGGYYDPEVIP